MIDFKYLKKSLLVLVCTWRILKASWDTHNENGHKTGQCGVPVSSGGGRLSHQDTVEDEITKTQLHPSCEKVNQQAFQYMTLEWK